MNGAVQSITEITQIVVFAVRRRRWLALGIAFALAILSSASISFLPNRYEAKAQVYVDTQTVLKPLMAGLTFQPDVDQQVRMLAKTLISRPNMQRLQEVTGLQLSDPDPERREEILNRLMTKISMVSAGSDNLYEISYRGNSPDQAKHLVEAVVDLFVRSGVTEKQRDSEDAGQFIEQQIKNYEEKLVEAEGRLKDFKVRNFGATGVSAQDYFTRISVISEEVSKLQVELNAAEKARDAYRQALNTEIMQNGDGAADEIRSRLDAQHKLLDEYLHRFTEQHPDVINARRIIAELTAELKRLKDTQTQGSSALLKEQWEKNNPVHQKLKVSLAETEAQVASLRAQLNTKRALLEEARAVGDRMPQVEAELAQLNRDYDVIRKNYEVMVARREAAQLGVKLNESSQLAEFRVVEPPKVSKSPVFPSRLHLALIAVLAVCFGSIGVTVAIGALKPTVGSISALQRLTSRPVLGAISLQISPMALAAQRADTSKFICAAALLMLLQVVWVWWIAVNP